MKISLKSVYSPGGIITFLYLSVAVFFNLKFLHGSNVNYAFAAHDEYLTVKEVYSILEPLSLKHFFMSIISGDILYYGRLMFYSDALIAFLPYKIFGLEGLVFATRMFHAILLLAGVIIISKTFIKEQLPRLLFVVTALFTYYSFYFMMLPKPEPHQLFVLSLFFNAFFKSNFKPGRYFLLLGLAFGLKFNAILLIPIIILWILVNQKTVLKEWIAAAVYFFAGLVIAVPCLLLSVIKPVFLKSYLAATFLNTGNVDDNPEHGLFHWIRFVWPTYYSGGWILLLLMFVTIFGLLIYNYRFSIREYVRQPLVFIIICGLALIIPIILTTHRLYPHYLWTGQIFIWTGAFGMLSASGNYRKISTVLAIVLTISGVLYTARSFQSMLNWEKTALPAIVKVETEQKKILDVNNKASIVQDISVYYPFRLHVSADPYHPFSSPVPGILPFRNVYWISPISPEIIDKMKPDYIFFGRAYISIIQKPLEQKAVLLEKKLKQDYKLRLDDEELVIWERNNHELNP